MNTSSIKFGTIVAILGHNNFFGVVMDKGQFETSLNNIIKLSVDGYQLYCGEQGYKYLAAEQFEVINTNYFMDVTVGLTLEEASSIFKEFEIQFNDLSKQTNAKKAAYDSHIQDEFVKNLKSVKPKEVKKEYLFNSIYTPNGLKITVGKVRTSAKKYFAINGQNLTQTEIEVLDNIVNSKIAGLVIADTTIKIGGIIGDTGVLRSAIYYYKTLKK